ncbi:MAG: agmatine deiminase family protein [Bacteroidia bacterium]|nr:agmatine deiminase family protein [Bacteroidia bacterium]
MKPVYPFYLCFLFLSLQLHGQEGHRMGASENALIPAYMNSRGPGLHTASVTPPVSPVRTIAEWEELQALVLGWKSYPSILREIVRAAKAETRVIIVYESPDNSSSLTSYLAAGGVDTVNVTLLNAPLNSVWSRDYGPWSAYTNDVDTLITIDWIYNRPRPEDDAVPQVISNFIGTPFYETSASPLDLVHTGGNFMTDGFGTGFSSNLVLTENSPAGGFGINHSVAEVDSIMQLFMGIQRYIKMNTLPYDVIHHIDMHMKLLDEETLLMGQYPPGVADGPQIEANLLYVLNNFNSVYGTPYKVLRIPMPDDNNLYPNNGGDYYTYTNSSFINKTVILPVYGIPEDSIAINTYRENLPGYTIAPINCSGMIGALGALHCITKEVGTDEPLLISHQALPNTTDTLNGYLVNARIQHRSGLLNAFLYWRTDTLQPWQQVILFPAGPSLYWIGFIPPQPAGTRVYYYIEATSTTGKTQVRPMPAPAGYWKFDVTGTTALAELSDEELLPPVFPNPCSAITCVPVQLPFATKARITLLDASGRTLRILHDAPLAAGPHRFFLDAALLEDGLYLVQMQIEDRRISQKLMVRH